MNKIILINGKTPNVETLKDVIKSNPNAIPLFTGMGAKASKTFIQSNKLEIKRYLVINGFKSKTKEEITSLISKKGCKVIAEIGDDILRPTVPTVKKPVEKPSNIFATRKQAKEAADKFELAFLLGTKKSFKDVCNVLGGVYEENKSYRYAYFYYDEGNKYYRIRDINFGF